MLIVCTTPEMWGTIQAVDYESTEGWVREVTMEYEGRAWACPLIFPYNAWRLANSLAIPVE